MDFASTFNNLLHQMAFFNLTVGNFFNDWRGFRIPVLSHSERL